MKPIKSLIVDDEELARENLKMLLEDFCPEVEVVGTAHSVGSAKMAIERLQPEAVFLDIRMPSGSEGFELLEDLPEKKFQVVFVTAFKDYAIKAFNANAIHYLLKPVDIEDLQLATKKLARTTRTIKENPTAFNEYKEAIENLSIDLMNTEKIGAERITVNHAKGFKVIRIDDIISLEGDGNCTNILLLEGQKFLDTRTLKVYEELLPKSRFFRTHKSHIINLQYLEGYSNENGHFALLPDSKMIPISRNKLKMFLDTVKNR